MSIHIGAKKSEVASTVLLPGDPLRAKHIAETHLEEVMCYNEVRGMYGYTGFYRGRRMSVQGTGMGIPSASIYIHELITEYGATTLMRVGTCGGLHADMSLGDVLLITAASTDSAFNRPRFGADTFAPAADYSLLRAADKVASEMGIGARVGTVFSTDTFYHEDPDYWQKWADYGVLAIEMETAALYTLAAKFGCRALSILTVSDVIPTGAKASAAQRETAYTDMARIALAIEA
jgi:purine-nucleoside phosphorylase